MPDTPRPAARPTLTQRRKADTRLEIARTAAALFAAHGAAATTAEEIARASGVGLRTFYRYFRAKEDAVEPLLADGARRWLSLLAESPRGALPGPAAVRAAAVDALTPRDDAAVESMGWTRGLLRAAADDPALRTVWFRINAESERRLAELLADLAGPDADPLAVRLAAASTTAAIRVAVETWAAVPDAPATGPGSPSDLVVRCLAGLTGPPAARG